MSALDRFTDFIGFMAIGLIRAYQVGISPMNPWGCKFHPSCSHYAVEAVRLHGPWSGAWLAVKRLGRCRPGTFGGIDPVPELEDVSKAAIPVAEATGLNTRSNTAGAYRRVERLRYSRGQRPLPSRFFRGNLSWLFERFGQHRLEGASGPARTSGGQSNSTGRRLA